MVLDDALLYMLHRVYRHLESAGASARILFFCFSNAFNTIQPHILVKKLLNWKINNNSIAWVMEYLTSRPQFVKIGDLVSNTILTILEPHRLHFLMTLHLLVASLETTTYPTALSSDVMKTISF